MLALKTGLIEIFYLLYSAPVLLERCLSSVELQQPNQQLGQAAGLLSLKDSEV